MVNVWEDLLNQYHGEFSQLLPLVCCEQSNWKLNGAVTLPSSMSADNFYSNVLFEILFQKCLQEQSAIFFAAHHGNNSGILCLWVYFSHEQIENSRIILTKRMGIEKRVYPFFAISSVFESFQRQVERQLE